MSLRKDGFYAVLRVSCILFKVVNAFANFGSLKMKKYLMNCKVRKR